jgi:hypothetical protein
VRQLLRGAPIRVGMLLALLSIWPQVASARVVLEFRSFNGSYFWGHLPHAFIQLDGTLDSDGRRVHENFGYTVVKLTPAILSGYVQGTVEPVEEDYVRHTNLHFAVPISDEQYHAVVAEMVRWRDAPGKVYNIDTHNCISFVAAMAQLVGLRADVPPAMRRAPKAWLNYIGDLNPQVHARHI